MSPIKVLVHGALGKVGREVVKTVNLDPETELVGAVDAKATGDSLTEGTVTVPLVQDLGSIIDNSGPEVIVDFTLAKAAMPAVRLAVQKGVNVVIGTTGFTAGEVDEMDRLARENGVGIILGSNFALGAVLMMHLAKICAKYFDFAEIVELHHNQKADAPSGTSLTTARGMVESRGEPFAVPPGPARGEMIDGISIHSVRLPGMLAHQEVIFGTAGQTLKIRHDSINRECFMPGVMLAVKEVINRPGLTRGLDKLLNL
jgi:4-hydroxy-tetrahydrodipicolinate reductase